jgi:hypothetical protein
MSTLKEILLKDGEEVIPMPDEEEEEKGEDDAEV